MADVDYDFDAEGFDGSSDPQAREGAFRRYVNLAGALTSLGLMIGAGVWGYNLAVRDVQGVPVIQALEDPMRVAPTDPGGEIIDYQGLAVNEVAAVGAAAPMPDRLVLAPRPIDLSAEDLAGLSSLDPSPALIAEPATATIGGTVPDLAASPQGESANPTAIAIDAALAEALGETPLDPAQDPALAPVEAMVAAEPVSDVVPEGAMVLSPRPKPRPTRGETVAEPAEAPMITAAEVDPETIAVGTRLVQFGAFESESEARAEWARLEGRFGEVMAGKSLVLQPAESGGRTFVRLRAHGFEDEDDARRFCATFAAEGLVCIPVPQR